MSKVLCTVNLSHRPITNFSQYLTVVGPGFFPAHYLLGLLQKFKVKTGKVLSNPNTGVGIPKRALERENFISQQPGSEADNEDLFITLFLSCAIFPSGKNYSIFALRRQSAADRLHFADDRRPSSIFAFISPSFRLRISPSK